MALTKKMGGIVICGGISCVLSKMNISLEYRKRHISNAGIKQPNSVIDNSICLPGIGGSF
jgi:hypothetical protein